ncbi:MAG: response regulator [Chloroflexaceae bacterium]|nr:response regulator [Chloroflexaceae bacterium]
MNRPSTILIVDDDLSGRETLEALLMSPGYQLAFAHDGPSALEQAGQLLPDLILLDVMMPGMDGFEVCRRLRQDPRLAEVPIIMVTALDDRESRLQGIQSGADDFISKPFNRAELRSRVQTILRLNRYRHLLTERARFEWVVEHTEDGYVIVDEHDRIRYANPQARLYLSLPPHPAEIPGDVSFLAHAQKQYHCEPQQAWETWLQNLNEAPPNPDACPLYYLVRPETPTTPVLWLRVDRIDMPGNAWSNRLVRLRDVTEKMTRKRQMWTFHALISHKLNTPLTSLINSLYLLAGGAENLSPEEVREFSSIAFQSAQRLRKHLEDIRAYVRAPDLTRSGEACDAYCFEHMLAQVQEELELETIHLSGQEHFGSVHLMLSKQAVEVMLHQILENAKKFHPSQSPAIEVSITRRADEVSIVISDDGITLSPDQLAEVGTPYYQAEKLFSGEVKGMGLGLAMVASLLWSVGGHYHIANRDPGPGLTIEMVVPLMKAVEGQ